MVTWRKPAVPVGFLFCVVFTFSVNAEYLIPEVKLEALKSGGFRAAIPDIEGTVFFRFAASVNEDISATKPGKLKNETSTSTNDFFVLYFDQKLNPNDVVSYEILVYHRRLGYRKDGLKWRVKESDLKDTYSRLAPQCRIGLTTINGGQSTCTGELIFSDDFNGPSVATSTWIVEQRIPTYSDYEENQEFNSYQNIDETRFIKNGILYLKPIALQTDSEVRGTLDLNIGCTTNDRRQCSYTHQGIFLLPPVKSARIKSKTSFKYGKIEIKAKLPSGEWILPVIELETNNKASGEAPQKILIAYSRGNDRLRGPGGDDIGSRVLYSGPIINPLEPERSKNLVKRPSSFPHSDEFHVYTLEWTPWTPDKLKFYIDGSLYGETSADGFNKENVLSLGVAVGGLNDFPDDYISGTNPKPWSNIERESLKTFFEARGTWLKTWNGDNSALQIDYVKVWAV